MVLRYNQDVYLIAHKLTPTQTQLTFDIRESNQGAQATVCSTEIRNRFRGRIQLRPQF
jgi:hypothetical protein